MAKHPVPKKKMSQARTAMRYRSFVGKKHRKITNVVRLTPCGSCGNPRLLSTACPSCGMFRDRSVRGAAAQTSKVTKIKA